MKKHIRPNLDPVWAIKLQRTFKESSPTTSTKFTKTMLLIYCLNQTFVVTVLTTIFVSDFPLLTKVLTDFVHPPSLTLWTLLGAQQRYSHPQLSPSSPWQLLPKQHLPQASQSSLMSLLTLRCSLVQRFRGLAYQPTDSIFSPETQIPFPL